MLLVLEMGIIYSLGANALEEEVIYAELDLKGTRNKRVVIVLGEFELRLFEERRPEFYHKTTE